MSDMQNFETLKEELLERLDEYITEMKNIALEDLKIFEKRLQMTRNYTKLVKVNNQFRNMIYDKRARDY